MVPTPSTPPASPRGRPLVERDFRLEVYFSRWEFRAKYLLSSSDMETRSMADLVALADRDERRRWETLGLGYTETWGLPALREAIAETYPTLGRENVLCFAGAEEGLFVAMHALLGPGDHAIVTVPNYQSAETVPRGLCEVSGLPLEPDEGWTVDLDRLEALIRPETRLISINFPNNPTGKILERDRFDGLIEIARARGIAVFSDEVYRGIERDPELRLPQVADVYERGFSLNVMSKAYGLAGLRVGWIASRDTAALLRMERIKHYLSICNSAPGEVLALVALNHREAILEENRRLVSANLGRIGTFFEAFPELFEWYEPDGGCVAFPRYVGPGTAEEFVETLAEEKGVLLLPPSIYRSDLCPVPVDRFRVGYGRANLPEALEITRTFLDSWKG